MTKAKRKPFVCGQKPLGKNEQKDKKFHHLSEIDFGHLTSPYPANNKVILEKILLKGKPSKRIKHSVPYHRKNMLKSFRAGFEHGYEQGKSDGRKQYKRKMIERILSRLGKYMTNEQKLELEKELSK